MLAARAFLGLLDGPISDHYGFDRGHPVDRVFIEDVRARHERDVRGRVLEVKGDGYTRRFGGRRVEQCDVLDLTASAATTIVADLNERTSLPADTFDCIILTQVLQFLDPVVAIPNLYGSLRSGGVMLISIPVLCRLELAPPDLWRLTAAGLAHLLRRDLPPEAVITTEQRGNAVAAVGFLLGLASDELRGSALERDDARFPVVSLARVCRP